jgi:hypothetical protein
MGHSRDGDTFQFFADWISGPTIHFGTRTLLAWLQPRQQYDGTRRCRVGKIGNVTLVRVGKDPICSKNVGPTMKILFLIATILFFMKLAWNALLPIFLLLRFYQMRKKEGGEAGAVSMAPFLEIAILIILAAIAAYDSANRWSVVEVLGYGICAVLASFGLCAIFGTLCRKIMNASELPK